MPRKVVQELKLARLILHPPTGRRGNLRCSPVEVTVLLAQEIDPPENVKPLTWWLMSSVPLNILKDPAQLISWYLKRWQIEIFFKILKSGCQVEKLQLETSERTRSCIALYLIIAWRVLFISSQFKNTPEFTCEVILEKKEWQVLWLLVQGKNIPDEPPHVQTAILMIAKLGGYLARKNNSPPGPKAIWRGLTKLYHAITAIKLAETTYG